MKLLTCLRSCGTSVLPKDVGWSTGRPPPAQQAGTKQRGCPVPPFPHGAPLPTPATGDSCKEINHPGRRLTNSRPLCCDHQPGLASARGCTSKARVGTVRGEMWDARGGGSSQGLSWRGCWQERVCVSWRLGNNLAAAQGKIVFFPSRSFEPRLKLKCYRNNPCPEQLALFQG